MCVYSCQNSSDGTLQICEIYYMSIKPRLNWRRGTVGESRNASLLWAWGCEIRGVGRSQVALAQSSSWCGCKERMACKAHSLVPQESLTELNGHLSRGHRGSPEGLHNEDSWTDDHFETVFWSCGENGLARMGNDPSGGCGKFVSCPSAHLVMKSGGKGLFCIYHQSAPSLQAPLPQGWMVVGQSLLKGSSDLRSQGLWVRPGFKSGAFQLQTLRTLSESIMKI